MQSHTLTGNIQWISLVLSHIFSQSVLLMSSSIVGLRGLRAPKLEMQVKSQGKRYLLMCFYLSVLSSHIALDIKILMFCFIPLIKNAFGIMDEFAKYT